MTFGSRCRYCIEVGIFEKTVPLVLTHRFLFIEFFECCFAHPVDSCSHLKNFHWHFVEYIEKIAPSFIAQTFRFFIVLGLIGWSDFQSIDSTGSVESITPQKCPYPKRIFLILGDEFCERFTYYGMIGNIFNLNFLCTNDNSFYFDLVFSNFGAVPQ